MDQSRTQARESRLLSDLFIAPGVLVARCRCGAVTPMEVNAFTSGDPKRAPLARLEEGLRCTCGARSGSIEVWPRGLPIPSRRDRLFLFGG